MKKFSHTSSVPHSSRLASYSKVAVGSLAAASAAGSADAAIVFFDVNPDQTINVSTIITFGNINLGAIWNAPGLTGTYTLNDTGGDYLRFSLESSFWTQFSNIESAGQFGGYFAYKLAYGSPINDTALTDWSSYNRSLINWDSGGPGYIALRIPTVFGYNYGWAQLDYVRADTASTLTISGFAFEDQLNTAILAGDTGGGPAPVPEPGTMAVGAGLFALAVGAHLRRRREKKAAAPDALLNLAAGARGVEKFRADKAA